MHHGMGFHGGYGLLIIFAVAGIIVAIILAALFATRNQRASRTAPVPGEGLADEEPLDQRILHYISDKDRPVLQGALCRQFTVDAQEIDRALTRLQEDRLVERYWPPRRGRLRCADQVRIPRIRSLME